MQDISVHISFAKSVIYNVDTHGLNLAHLLQKSRIPAQLLTEPNARLSATQYADLQRYTMREMDDEMLGYSDKPLKLGCWTAACHWAIEASNLGQAIKRFSHFYSLMERGMRQDVHLQGDTLTITYASWQPGQIFPPHPYESFLFTFHRLLCWLAAEIIPIRMTLLPYPEPDYSQEYRGMLMGSPIRFQQPVCSLQFDAAIASKPIKRNPEELKRFLRNPLLTMLVDIHNTNNWAARTRQAIGTDIQPMPSFADIAGRLDIHPKKLSRLLTAEGVSYSQLKSQLRRDIAIFYLTKRGASVEEVAFKTGFSEASAFIRAFKSWTGVTPYTYRKDMR